MRITAVAIYCCLLSSANAGQQLPLLSLVIDDLGYSLERGRAAIKLPGDHTYGVIPGALYSKKLADFAIKSDKEIILHLPLQATNPLSAAEKNALNSAMDEEQLSHNLNRMLEEMPGIKGVNNHMGSLLTQIDYFMRPIMDVIRAHNPELYFLDSRTSANSVAYNEALNYGLASVRRDIFLDNDHTNPQSIHFQFQLWLGKARKRGYAVAIGHPHPNTLQYLRQHLRETKKHFQFLSVSQLIEQIRLDNAALNRPPFFTSLNQSNQYARTH